MKKITVDFSRYGEIEEKYMPATHIGHALYKKNLGGNPIYLDEETDIIYAPICTKDHFERFYGNVKEESTEKVRMKSNRDVLRETFGDIRLTLNRGYYHLEDALIIETECGEGFKFVDWLNSKYVEPKEENNDKDN